MDAIRRNDLEIARRTSPSEKLSQALEMMRAGFRPKRIALRERYPHESESERDERFRQARDGMAFADALHVFAAPAGTEFVSFDRALRNVARRTGCRVRVRLP